jgi:hypothetical protein
LIALIINARPPGPRGPRETDGIATARICPEAARTASTPSEQDDGPAHPAASRGTGLERPVSHENCPSAARLASPAFAQRRNRRVRTTLLFTMSANRRHSTSRNAANLDLDKQARNAHQARSARASPFGLRL